MLLKRKDLSVCGRAHVHVCFLRLFGNFQFCTTQKTFLPWGWHHEAWYGLSSKPVGRVQQRVLGLLELELQVVVCCLIWVLGIERGSYERIVCALNCWAVVPPPPPHQAGPFHLPRLWALIVSLNHPFLSTCAWENCIRLLKSQLKYCPPLPDRADI